MHRLRTSGHRFVPLVKRKASNAFSAVQDTFYSTKDIFETHKVVFTISTSLASIGTAWAGYTLRHLHESKVEQRLDSIEKAMNNNYQMEHKEFKKLVGSGGFSTEACVATAGTSLIIGYGLGWRGGKWYANRKFKKEQLKLLGQIKPKRWQLKFLRRPLLRPRSPENAAKTSDALQKDLPVAQNSGETIPHRNLQFNRVNGKDNTHMHSMGRMANSLTICILVFLLCVSFLLLHQFLSSSDSSSNSYVGICESMVEPQGYSCEEHTVTTTDGYILSLQRIPAGRSGVTADKPPVLLQHGVFSDATTWLVNTPDQSLGFILADNGYDVWLANTRGTKYSSGHTSLSPSDPVYWDWSWDELAAYDLPASVKYVYDQTGQNLHYVGHSLGTLMALAAFSKQQSLNMTRSAALLAPIAYLDQITTLLGKAAAYSMIGDVLYWLGIDEFKPGGEAVTNFMKGICKITNIDCSSESSLTSAFAGPPCCISPSTMDAVANYGSQPTATKNMLHLAQMVRQGTIAMYDYGSEDDNNEHYGQPTPPVYNMSSIPNDLPLFLAHGGQDYLSDPVDVQSLMGALSDHDADKLVVLYPEEYAHLDFTLAGNANQVVYDPIMGFFSLN
ncbi:hypothetical protein RHGRI_017964 [Rhododendron griersonianum]|uniref:Partial AB-hydrolase lipase domain-containing protein n=2 Tax=Rhododendron TaxID=4346 RepID=A0AAV6JZQ9_9ERIC|nr:hypothetical protein RHGRI_017964 [Rhododendron griersonianum]